jgi:uncharacterized protein
MNFHEVHSASHAAGAATDSAPPADKVIEGDPRFKTWFATQPSAELICGIWEATPGTWISEKGKNWEFFTVISGVSEFTETGKAPIRLEAGGTFAMQPRCVGTWRVIETTRKSFVIRNG